MLVLERTNAKTLEAEHVGGLADLVVVDASFIGLGKLLTAIARIGFERPGPSPKTKRRTLKSVAQSLVFLRRVKRASEAWRKECEAKPAIKAALDDVRRRRAKEAAQSARAG